MVGREMREEQSVGLYRTADGHPIRLFATVGNLEEAVDALQSDVAGIGLFQSEFLYHNQERLPSETEQCEIYASVLQQANDRPVVIRTLDISKLKKADFLSMPPEENPSLGSRAIRFSLSHPEIFQTQLRALLRAGRYGRAGLLFPMIENVSEIRDVKQCLQESMETLLQQRLPYAEHVPIGLIVETPAAALMADLLAVHVDFLVVGINDLTQYTLAADRGNDRVAYLYDAAHPAVLRLAQQVCQAAHRVGIPVGVCGALAEDTEMTEALIGLGFDAFCITPKAVSSVAARIAQAHLWVASELASRVLERESASDVRTVIRGKGPET
ncbi:MAG: phosphoenolpyruvate--protein phosphotransferase [Firmicutes bacterium]|nr:phosphoenolpyruvate--protein phosphotransferase [Bacillota bacterium]